MKSFDKWISILLLMSVLLSGCVMGGPQTDPSTVATTASDPSVDTTAPTDSVIQPTDPASTAPTDPASTAPTDPAPTAPTDPAPTVPTDPAPTIPTVPVLVKISLASHPHKIQYYVGELLNTTGGIILCEYSDGSTKQIMLTNSAVMGFTSEQPGIYTLTIQHMENGIIAETVYSITVKEAPKPTPVLRGIRLQNLPKTEYTLGEPLDTTGGIILCEYTDGTSKRVNLKNSDVTGFANINAPGTYELTVTYKENGVLARTTYTITVVSASMWQGSGTANDPFLIRNLNDLLNLRNVLDKSGYYYRQVANIDCASLDWNVIGDSDHPFRHHIDGGGYKISNLNFVLRENAYDNYLGLFAQVENAGFKNIHLENAVIKKESVIFSREGDKIQCYGVTAGALAASAYNCTFENCTASVDFRTGAPGEGSESGGIGGLVGSLRFASNQKVLMKNCSTSGKIEGNRAGGLVGVVWAQEDYYARGEEPKASIENCSSSVEILEAYYGYVGGLIGMSDYLSLYHCHTTGNVTSFGRYMGGLVGFAENTGEFAYCYATGQIRATSDYQYGYAHAGGLIGYMNSHVTVHDCYATGDVHSVGIWSDCQDDSSRNGGIRVNYRNPCGSLIGTLYAKAGPKYGYKINVYNCYATGFVYAENICENEKTYCHGALVGFVYDDDTRGFMIDPAKKDQSDWAGFKDSSVGLFGNNYNVENLRTFYRPMDEMIVGNWEYVGKHEAMPTYHYVKIIDQAALKNQSTFEGWDFTNVWKMGANGPELR